jgi:hypothetical protein
LTNEASLEVDFEIGEHKRGWEGPVMWSFAIAQLSLMASSLLVLDHKFQPYLGAFSAVQDLTCCALVNTMPNLALKQSECSV